MAKAERFVLGNGCAVGANQLLSHKCGEMRPDRRSDRGRGELGDRAAVEDLALDRASLDDDALVAVQPVEPGLEQRVDRRGHDDLVPSLRSRTIASISST